MSIIPRCRRKCPCAKRITNGRIAFREFQGLACGLKPRNGANDLLSARECRATRNHPMGSIYQIALSHVPCPGLQRSLLGKDENSIKKAPLAPQKQHRPECKALIPLGIESGIGMN